MPGWPLCSIFSRAVHLPLTNSRRFLEAIRPARYWLGGCCLPVLSGLAQGRFTPMSMTRSFSVPLLTSRVLNR